MSRYPLVLPLIASPAAAQIKTMPKATAGHPDLARDAARPLREAVGSALCL